MLLAKNTTFKYRSLIISLLLAIFVCGAQAQAPEPIVLFDEEITLNRFSSQKYTFNFETGDKLIYSIRKVSKFPVKSVEILGKDGTSLAIHEKPDNIINKTITINKTGDYTFKFRSQKFVKSLTGVTIKRIPKIKEIIYRDTLMIDTVITMEKVEKKVFDTIPEEVIQESVALDAVKNIYGIQRKCIALPLPEDSLNYFWVYWVGIGPKSVEAITELEAEPPLAWQREEITNALIAYGMSIEETLPTINVLDEIEVQFLGSKGQNQFLAKQAIDSTQVIALKNQAFGKVNLVQNLALSPISACFQNNNPISPQSITLKIMGFLIEENILETEVEKIAITQRIEKIPE